MKFFFEPENVALIGATDKKGKPGRSLHTNLSTTFGDGYYPVNPRGGELDGHKAYKSILDIPVTIDVAIIFIPSHLVLSAVEQCVAKGVKGIIIESAGFSEVGAEGRKLQDRIVELARSNGIRVWGPNCMGVINAHKMRVMSFMSPRMWEEKLTPGGISLVVQSGMLSAGFLMSALGRSNFGLSKVCSIGNKADVDELDILEYMLEDGETSVIAMYLESIKEGRRFLEAAKSAEKPIVVLKGGTTEAGAKAAVSHTASMAGNRGIVDGALKQAGVIRVEGFYEMLDVARVLDQFGPRKAEPARIAIITFSGAAGIVNSDIIENMGMKVAEFSAETARKLEEIYPSWMPPENPADIYPAMEIHGPAKTYMTTLECALADPGVDAVIVHLFGMRVPIAGVNLESWFEAVKKHNKPVVAWLMGDPDTALTMSREMESRGIPVVPDIRRAVGTLKALFR